MRVSNLATWVLAGVICLAAAPVIWIALAHAADSKAAAAKHDGASGAKDAPPAAPQFPNALCLGCHGNKGFGAPGPDGQMR